MTTFYVKIKSNSIAVVFWAVWIAIACTAPALAETAEKSLQKAQVLSQKGDWDGAIREFENALKEKPNDSATQANLGVALSRVDRHKEALLAFQKALEMG